MFADFNKNNQTITNNIYEIILYVKICNILVLLIIPELQYDTTYNTYVLICVVWYGNNLVDIAKNFN